MKKVVKGFIVYRTESWYGEDERFQFWPWDPRGDKGCKDKVFVAEHAAEIDVPENFDPRPQQVAQLVAQKEEARKQFAALCTEIDRRINKLQALEMTVEA